MKAHLLSDQSCPRLEISLEKIQHNTEIVVKKCRHQGIHVAGVTKVFCGQERIAQSMKDGGVELLADSRIENLERLRSIQLPKMLIRIPMISQVSRVVELADISLNSELATICALSSAASKIHRLHQVILMVDLGDLREGIFDQEEIFRTVEKTLKFDWIHLAGIGVNFSCFGGVLPTSNNLEKLLELAQRINDNFTTVIEIVSGGNSSSLYLVEEEAIPRGINQLRIGEAIVLGRETAFGRRITGMHPDCFKLHAEIVELKEKPSVPIGEVGFDSFGRIPSFVDKGIRKRAICAVGKQDVAPENILPEDKEVVILGASSDHLILDVTEADRAYSVGDEVSFYLTYGGILSCMTSEYVMKTYS